MAHTFSFDLPGDPATALKVASSAVTSAGGTFSGDANAGSFSGKTPVGAVKGNYQVAGRRVTIDITDQPFVVPKAMIESKVREFFGA
jgi:hypothetical protein